MTSRPLAVLGAPSSAGAYGPGQEAAPAALRERGLLATLARHGMVTDLGDIEPAVFRSTPGRHLNNADAVRRVAADLRDRVTPVLRGGDDLLVIGGDCTIALGVVAGALRCTGSVGLVYVDLDADLTTARTGDGILDWTGVAHLLGLEDTDPALAGLGPRTPMLHPRDVVLVGLDRPTDDEREVIDQQGIAVESLQSIREDLGAAVARVTRHFADRQVVLVHVDADVLRRDDLSIADNERRVDGLHPDELEALLVGLLAMPHARALTLAEVNPDRAESPPAELDRLVHLLAATRA